ncbi:hypothetical protein CRG98_028555 [Punica granatum]|uniref:N-acetyltransferase domain-containing protein n=1 Tax=Punica granatum TaxID=22663 RepID=A0A2I0J493_PUNGR|nr:hypothetical protein CRG98_028555 [Punica granatum]
MRTQEEALAHVKNVAIPHPWCQSICLDGHSIGYISVRPGSNDERHWAYVSYAIGADLWGQGIGTFTLRSVVSEVFGEFPDLVSWSLDKRLDITMYRVLPLSTQYFLSTPSRVNLTFTGTPRDPTLCTSASTLSSFGRSQKTDAATSFTALVAIP